LYSGEFYDHPAPATPRWVSGEHAHLLDGRTSPAWEFVGM